MATFWERATHSVNRTFFLYCLFVILVISHFGFESKSSVLIAPILDNAYLLIFLLCYFPGQSGNLTILLRRQTSSTVLLVFHVFFLQKIISTILGTKAVKMFHDRNLIVRMCQMWGSSQGMPSCRKDSFTHLTKLL